jgi:hypothetical protein
MDDLWFVLLTIILQKPVLDGGPEKIGDVLKSSLIGATITEAECQAAADATADAFYEIGGGSVAVVTNCVLLPASVGDAQGMEPTPQRTDP